MPGTKADDAYDLPQGAALRERHRHRWEFNNKYRDVLAKKGLVLSGFSPDGELVEIAELRDHPFMLGTQFHPEFLSRPNRPHPLFRAFVSAAKEHRRAVDGPNNENTERLELL
jgi:CTP synthase